MDDPTSTKPVRPCAHCGEPLAPNKRSDAVYCTPQCKLKARDTRPTSPARKRANQAWQQANRDRVNEASRRYRTKYPERRASQNRSYKNRNREHVRIKSRKDSLARAARVRGATIVERFSLQEIAERDGWRCHICGKRVRKDIGDTRRDSRAATMDHLIPVSKGGPHSRDNVALAHRGCNSRKGVRAVGEQLRLIG